MEIPVECENVASSLTKYLKKLNFCFENIIIAVNQSFHGELHMAI